MVYFCYIDESGTPNVPGNTSHYILAGLSIPVSSWKKCEKNIAKIKQKYDLANKEVHTAWLARKYIEQAKIINFNNLSFSQRRSEVEKLRKTELFKLQKAGNKTHYKQTKKNYNQTEAYIHLSYNERLCFIREIADMIGHWSFARIFGECINKIHFDPSIAKSSVDEQALEQLVSRFEQYMKIVSKSTKDDSVYGTLIHDNNETVSKKHTELMKKFHVNGTLWTTIDHIIETPFFVNSELTSMVQIADLCSYALRRYLENSESDLFDRIKVRFDRKDGKIVGVRHFTNPDCLCEICNF